MQIETNSLELRNRKSQKVNFVYRKEVNRMKIFKIALFSFLTVCLVFSFAFAAGNVEKGKALFNDPKVAGGTSGKSCNSCHPDGKGLEKSAEKKEFNIMGQKQTGLEEAVNFCIVNAIKGKAIDSKSEQMKDIVTYIKSLKPAEMPKKGY
jgi:cytochrome c553